MAELLYTRRSRICFAMALNPPPRVGVNSHYQKKRVRKWSDTVWECCRSGVGTQPCWVDLRWPPPSSLPINHSANYSSNYVITMPLKHIQHKLRKVKGSMEIRPEKHTLIRAQNKFFCFYWNCIFCIFILVLQWKGKWEMIMTQVRLEHALSTLALVHQNQCSNH